MRRTPPTFHPGPLTYAEVEALNTLARDLYGSLLDRFSAAPPLQVRQGEGGVAYSLGAIEAGITGIIARKNSGTPDFGPETRINFVEGSNIVLGISDDPANNEIVVTITATAPAGTGIQVRDLAGTHSYTGVSIVTFDQTDGISVSQPVAGEARIDLLPATVSQAGIVSLAAQTMGTGTKTFNGTVQIDNTGFGLKFMDPGGAYSCTVGAGNLTGTRTFASLAGPGGTLRVGNSIIGSGVGSCDLQSLEATVAYAINGTLGGTATTGGLTFLGGLYISGTSSSTLITGSTPITGGSTGTLLTDSGGILGETSFADTNNVIGAQVFST